VNNELISLLSYDDRTAMDRCLERVEMKTGDVLFEPHRPIEYAYFFEEGLSSEIAFDSDGERIEVGCVGKEGFSGAPIALGVETTPHKAFMQVGGAALRIRSSDLKELMASHGSIRSLLLRYLHVFMIQIASTALSDGRFDINQRLARWLLMAQDRLGRDELPLTHDFLSLMMGVRRSGVTDAIHRIEGERMIKATRGLITVRNRSELEKLAGGSYGVAEAEYRRVLSKL
jgi:CRP-like cAMP-binding protein